MKQTSANILNTLNNDNFIKNLSESLSKSANYIYGESETGERISYFQSISPVIIETINKGLFDQIPETKRKAIWSMITNINTNIQNFKNQSFNSSSPQGKNFLNATINSINNLQDYLDQTNLISKLQGVQDYEKELVNLTKQKRRYNKYLKEIDESVSILRNIQNKNNEAGYIIEVLQNAQSSSSNSIQVINKNLEDFVKIQDDINEIRQKIIDVETDIDTKKSVLDSAFSNSQNVQNTLKQFGTDLTTFKNNKEEEYKSHVDKIINENTSISDKAKSCLNDAKKLLEGATASRLYRAFNARKRQIEQELRFWLVGIFSINILILVVAFLLIFGINLSGININSIKYFNIWTFLILSIPIVAVNFFILKKGRKSEKTKKRTYNYFWAFLFNLTCIIILIILIRGVNFNFFHIKPMTSTPFDAKFLAKLLFIIPLALLDGFLIREYNFRKKLVEEYSYRSVLSISLMSYKDLIEREKGNPEIIKFINETVEKIYESPFDKNSISKKERNLLDKLLDKGIEKVDKLIKV